MCESLAVTPNSCGKISPTLRTKYGKDWNSVTNPSGPLVLSPLIFSAVGSPVRISQSPDAGAVFTPSEAGSSSSLPDWLESCAPTGCSLRTSQACSHRIKVKTSKPSSKRFPNSGMRLRGESWTAVISEFPSDAVECTLSDILEPTVPQRFYLSQRAAQGILRRAARRGKELPTPLREALEALAMGTRTSGTQLTSPRSVTPSQGGTTSPPDQRREEQSLCVRRLTPTEEKQ